MTLNCERAISLLVIEREKVKRAEENEQVKVLSTRQPQVSLFLIAGNRRGEKEGEARHRSG